MSDYRFDGFTYEPAALEYRLARAAGRAARRLTERLEPWATRLRYARIGIEGSLRLIRAGFVKGYAIDYFEQTAVDEALRWRARHPPRAGEQPS